MSVYCGGGEEFGEGSWMCSVVYSPQPYISVLGRRGDGEGQFDVAVWHERHWSGNLMAQLAHVAQVTGAHSRFGEAALTPAAVWRCASVAVNRESLRQ